MTTTDAPPSPIPARSTSPDRDWWVVAGMTIAAASATLASFTGLRGLAEMTGWPDTLAWLLPVTLDAYAMTAARVWLAPSTRSSAARSFARANALVAITASITGNAAYHAVHAGLLAVTWPMIVIVGAVPAAILGLTAHLHALRGRTPAAAQPTRAINGAGSRPPRQPAGTPRARPTRRDDDALMTAAIAADTRYREKHGGKPITRDALRAALRISGPRATELRRRLATDADTPTNREESAHHR
jgi:hypothetical protein